MDYVVYPVFRGAVNNQKPIYSSLGHLHVNVHACSLYHLKQVQPAASNMATNEQSHLPQHAALCYLHRLRCPECWEVCSFTEGPWIPLLCRSGGLPGTGGCLGPLSKALAQPVLSRNRVTVSWFCFRHGEGLLNQKLHLFSRCLHSFNERARYPQILLPPHSLKWLRQKGTSCSRKSCRRMELSKCKEKFSQPLQI